MTGLVLRAAACAGALGLTVAALSGCVPEPRAVEAGPTTAATATARPSLTPTLSCAERIVAELTPAERAGQLIVAGLGSNEDVGLLDPLVASYHLSGVVLLSGWDGGAAAARAAADHLQSLAGDDTGGLGLLVSADQEGGQIQQLRGPGFGDLPSGVEQGLLPVDALRQSARSWGAELAAAGVNLNLAPVADTVPADLGRGNPPIGGYGRQYSSDPVAAASSVRAFVEGMTEAGVATTVKHFPGLGRVTGNTDVTAEGTTDTVTGAGDVGPFAAGIDAGAGVVMMSSAFYTQLDPASEAVFSRPIVTGLLRGQLGFDGVVMSDDIGVAAAVSSTAVEERATRFVAAGGDIALTADPAAVAPFHDSLLAAMTADPTFADRVEESATRVVRLKIDLGLATCG
ncbi:glycoside hydrolase family 3 N-terminal domain-containing protein [Microbacterium sp. 1P10UB]|uniref:glycoside hydrolase family 3 N-terminal domain-containing protein n=1 Tax=unclassified Microbacterium TaxID=2609290 RepID=UPI0039A22461